MTDILMWRTVAVVALLITVALLALVTFLREKR
jgi:hypothetical protein